MERHSYVRMSESKEKRMNRTMQFRKAEQCIMKAQNVCSRLDANERGEAPPPDRCFVERKSSLKSFIGDSIPHTQRYITAQKKELGLRLVEMLTVLESRLATTKCRDTALLLEALRCRNELFTSTVYLNNGIWHTALDRLHSFVYKKEALSAIWAALVKSTENADPEVREFLETAELKAIGGIVMLVELPENSRVNIMSHTLKEYFAQYSLQFIMEARKSNNNEGGNDNERQKYQRF